SGIRGVRPVLNPQRAGKVDITRSYTTVSTADTSATPFEALILRSNLAATNFKMPALEIHRIQFRDDRILPRIPEHSRSYLADRFATEIRRFFWWMFLKNPRIHSVQLGICIGI